MAGLISGTSGPSLGYGISLQKELDPSLANEIARDNFHAQQANKQKQVAAKKKSEDDLKALGNFKIPVVNPIYQGQLESAVGGLHNTLYDLTKSNDPDAIWKGQDAAQKASLMAAAAQESSKNADVVNQTRYAAANNKNVEPTDFAKKFFEEYDKSVAQKSPTDEFKKIVGNEQGFIPQSVTQQLYQPKEVNLVDWTPKYAKSLGQQFVRTETPTGDVFTTKSGKSVPDDVIKDDIARTIALGGPESRAILNAYGGPEKNDARAAVNEYFQYVKNKIPTSNSTTLTQKQSGLSEEQYKQGAGSIQLYPVQNEDGQDVGSVQANGVFTTVPVKVVAAKSTGTVDNRTMRSAQGAGEINGTSSEVRILPTSKNTGLPLKTEEVNKMISQGKSNDIVYSPFATIKSDEKRQVFNADGYNKAIAKYNDLPDEEKGNKPTKDEFTKDVSDEHGYSKPLKDVAGSFGKKLDVKKIENEAKIQTDKFHSENPSSNKKSNTPKELSGKINPSALVKDQEYIVSGKTYIWNGTKLVSK